MSAHVTNIAWRRPVTVADMMLIDALPPEVRAAVERYARQNGVVADGGETDYEKGWRDAMQKAEDELSSIHFPDPPTAAERERRRERDEARRRLVEERAAQRSA